MPKKQLKTRSKVKEEKPHHHGDLKAALIRAALEYLKVGSAQDLSLRDLARRAGVSQAAPYRHFKDKDDLIAAVAAHGYRELARQIKSVVVEFASDPTEQYYQAGLAYLRLGMQHPEPFKIMNESTLQHEHYFSHPELYLEAQRSYYALVKVILNGQKHGIIGTGSPLHRAMHCWMAVHGFTVLFLHGRISWLGVEGNEAEMVLRGFLQDLLYGMKRSQGTEEKLGTICAKPTPSEIFEDLGLNLEDFPKGTVELFDSKGPWPTMG